MPQIRVPEYEPSPRQIKFHTSNAFETLYGGAAGGGKTAAIVAEAVTYSLKWPKARTYILRKTINSLLSLRFINNSLTISILVRG